MFTQNAGRSTQPVTRFITQFRNEESPRTADQAARGLSFYITFMGASTQSHISEIFKTITNENYRSTRGIFKRTRKHSEQLES